MLRQAKSVNLCQVCLTTIFSCWVSLVKILLKNTAALAKRANSVPRFWQHCSEGLGTYPFIPFRTVDVQNYLATLKQLNKLSGVTDCAQCLNFCIHVAGLPAENVKESPWVRGVTRDSYLHRKTIRQSRTLTVSEVIARGL